MENRLSKKIRQTDDVQRKIINSGKDKESEENFAGGNETEVLEMKKKK